MRRVARRVLELGWVQSDCQLLGDPDQMSSGKKTTLSRPSSSPGKKRTIQVLREELNDPRWPRRWRFHPTLDAGSETYDGSPLPRFLIEAIVTLEPDLDVVDQSLHVVAEGANICEDNSGQRLE